jgi:GntR family transcriptional regulator
MLLGRHGPLPLHYQLSEDLRRRIGRGEFPVGSRLPAEQELMAQYGVARGTVRQALATLRSEGLIHGARGQPARVAAPPLRQSVDELISFSAWVRSIGEEAGGRVVEFAPRPADHETLSALGLERGTLVWHLVRVRLLAGEAVMVERTSFPQAIGELVAELDLESDSIYERLAEHGVDFAEAAQLVDAVAAAPLDARLLGVAQGGPLLRVRRRTVSPEGVSLEWSDDRYRPDRVVFSIQTSARSQRVARIVGEPREEEESGGRVRA